MRIHIVNGFPDLRRKGTDEDYAKLRAAGKPGSRAYMREAKRQSRARQRAAVEASAHDIDAIYKNRKAA